MIGARDGDCHSPKGPFAGARRRPRGGKPPTGSVG